MRNLLLFILLSVVINAQIFDSTDVKILNNKFKLATDNKLIEKPINEVIDFIGRSFIGIDYEAFACEVPGDEQLVIHLNGLDCTTFLENTFVISRTIKKGKLTFNDYSNELKLIRYRNGVINKYPSRLHYFSDWIFNNSEKGLIKDITKDIGGKELTFNLSFMSENPNLYMHLKSNPEFVAELKKQEQEINKRKYYFIPNDDVDLNESKIQTGDLIAIVTGIKGLDIGHVGIAVKEKDGRIHFMHAPITGSKVQITPDPIGSYLKKVKKHKGIIVLRPVKV